MHVNAVVVAFVAPAAPAAPVTGDNTNTHMYRVYSRERGFLLCSFGKCRRAKYRDCLQLGR